MSTSMFLPGELRREFTPTESPFWRQGKQPTSSSQMLSEIRKYIERYQRLPPEQKEWCTSVYFDARIAEFLYQVNFIEGEGFDTFAETRDAISEGLLADVSLESQPRRRFDEREEHVRSLYRATLFGWSPKDEDLLPNVRRVVKTHKMLLDSTNPELAGILRSRGVKDEIVGCRVGENPGDVHLFMYPTKVPDALAGLVEKTRLALGEVLRARPEDQVDKILPLAGSFFMEFECIHPFLDGNGRTGRILLARLLKSVTPGPVVLLVEDASAAMQEEPPFVEKKIYYQCHQNAGAKQAHEQYPDGRIKLPEGPEAVDSRIGYPCDLTALFVEAVYMAWKRFFAALEQEFGTQPASSKPNLCLLPLLRLHLRRLLFAGCSPLLAPASRFVLRR